MNPFQQLLFKCFLFNKLALSLIVRQFLSSLFSHIFWSFYLLSLSAYFLTALLRCNSPLVLFTLLKHTIHWFLTELLQTSAQLILEYFHQPQKRSILMRSHTRFPSPSPFLSYPVLDENQLSASSFHVFA